MRVLVAGGGISGLATAYYLVRQAEKARLPIDVRLVEAGGRLGGKVVTEHVDGFVIEGGPDAFLTTKPAAVDLCRELGLGERLLPTNEAQGAVHVLVDDRLRRIPAGFRLLAPTRLAPFLRSDLLSWPAKLRLGLDWVLPAAPPQEDESVGAFVRRRLGAEAVRRLAQPLLAGIYMADVERLSLEASFPQFRDYERLHGGVLRGLRAERRRAAELATAEGAAGEGQARAMFLSLRGGTQELVDVLASRLAAVVRTGVGVEGVEGVEERGDGSGPRFRVRLTDGTRESVDALVLAAPAPMSARIVEGLAPGLARQLALLRQVGSATVSLGYRPPNVPALPDGFGFVVAAGEPVSLRAATFSSVKFDHRAPPGAVLVRAFLGGDGREQDLEGEDDALVARVRADLARVLAVADEPVLARVFRWPAANPQYDVGHRARVAALEAACPPGLYLTGAAYHGVGVPDCVRSAATVAERIVAAATGPDPLPVVDIPTGSAG